MKNRSEFCSVRQVSARPPQFSLALDVLPRVEVSANIHGQETEFIWQLSALKVVNLFAVVSCVVSRATLRQEWAFSTRAIPWSHRNRCETVLLVFHKVSKDTGGQYSNPPAVSIHHHTNRIE